MGKEDDGGSLDGSPLINDVDYEVTYGTDSFMVVNFDIIGRWHVKGVRREGLAPGASNDLDGQVSAPCDRWAATDLRRGYG